MEYKKKTTAYECSGLLITAPKAWVRLVIVLVVLLGAEVPNVLTQGLVLRYRRKVEPNIYTIH